jgi:uncharacterized membrane protein YgcG
MTRRATLLLPIVMFAMIAASLASPAVAQDDDPPDAGPQAGVLGDPVAPLAEKRVYDMANLLNNGQEASIEMDAGRLARHGIPRLVIIQLGAMAPEEADAFAAHVRRQWGIESSPGADDGLVILVTVTDTEERRGIFTTMSWGDNALPHFGVTATSSAGIQRAWLDRYIDEGFLYEGIDFTLRRLIYHSIYDPAPQAPLTGLRANLGGVMSLAGPLLAIVAVALAARRWTRNRRAPELVDLALQWGVPVLAVAVFALAVMGHSGWGVAAAFVLLGVAALDWIARDPRRSTPGRVAS